MRALFPLSAPPFSGGRPIARRRPQVDYALVLLLGFFLYFPHLSTRYDPNGLIEARALERGQLISPHHMLYRPIALPLYRAFEIYTKQRQSVAVLQWLSAFSGALGLALYFRILRRMGLGHPAALGFTLALGTSWSYWVFSTDAAYIIPANTAAIAFLLALDEDPLSFRRAILAGGLMAVAVLLWQAHGILGMMWVARWIAIRKSSHPSAERSIRVGLIVAAVSIAAVYLGAGAWETRSIAPLRILQWALTYETRLPIWGRFHFERGPIALQSAIASWIPLWDGLGWRAALRGERIEGWGILCGLALIASLLALLPRLRCFIQKRPWWPVRAMGLTWLLYVLFILWWDPYEPKWFIMPNTLALLLLAYAWANAPGSRRAAYVLIASVAIMGGANLDKSIRPRHEGPHPLRERARCVAGHMGEADVLLATDWTWAEYVAYFHQRSVVSLPDLAARLQDPTAVQLALRRIIRETRQRSGRIYMPDPSIYPSESFRWLKATTGFTPAELEALRGPFAFACDDLRFFEVQEPGDPPSGLDLPLTAERPPAPGNDSPSGPRRPC